MHCVRFRLDGREVKVPRGTRLLDAVIQAGLPIARGCSGRALCGRCGLRILEGADTLAFETVAEGEAKRCNRVDSSLRLACCVQVAGDLEVTALYW